MISKLRDCQYGHIKGQFRVGLQRRLDQHARPAHVAIGASMNMAK